MNEKAGASLAYVALIVATLGWSVTPIFLRLLSDTFDPWTVTVYRYGAAFLPTFIASVLWFRDDLKRLFKEPRAILALGTLTTVMQYGWTAGTYKSLATTAQLIAESSVIFTIFFAYLFFREERAVIRRPLFILGTTLGIGGLAAVLAKQPGSFSPVVDSAALLLLGSAVLWGIYAVWSKHLVATVHPIPLFAAMAGIVTVGSIVLALLFGTRPDYATITPGMWTIAFVSGLIPLALCHPCYNLAQHRLGSSYCGAFILLTPLGTFVASAIFLPAEKLLPAQMVGGAMLLAGTLCATVAHITTPEADAIAPTIDKVSIVEELIRPDERVRVE